MGLQLLPGAGQYTHCATHTVQHTHTQYSHRQLVCILILHINIYPGLFLHTHTHTSSLFPSVTLRSVLSVSYGFTIPSLSVPQMMTVLKLEKVRPAGAAEHPASPPPCQLQSFTTFICTSPNPTPHLLHCHPSQHLRLHFPLPRLHHFHSIYLFVSHCSDPPQRTRVGRAVRGS